MFEKKEKELKAKREKLLINYSFQLKNFIRMTDLFDSVNHLSHLEEQTNRNHFICLWGNDIETMSNVGIDLAFGLQIKLLVFNSLPLLGLSGKIENIIHNLKL